MQAPLDHSDAGSRQITIAITVLEAADQAGRLGSIVVNPGVGLAILVYLCYAAFGGLLALRGRSDRVDRVPERTEAAHH